MIPCPKKVGPAKNFLDWSKIILDLQHSKLLLQACQELPFRIVIGRYSRHFHSGYFSSSSTRSGIHGMVIEWRNTKETFFPKFDNIFHVYLESKALWLCVLRKSPMFRLRNIYRKCGPGLGDHFQQPTKIKIYYYLCLVHLVLSILKYLWQLKYFFKLTLFFKHTQK